MTLPATQTALAPHDPPLKLTYTGTMEVAGSPVLDLTDIKPGMIRLIRGQPHNLNTTVARSKAILDAGVMLLPCIDTDGWTAGGLDNGQALGAFALYLQAWANGLITAGYGGLYWELGNEPQEALIGDASNAANKRKKYLRYLKAGADVLQPLGFKPIFSAQINDTGGMGPTLADLDAGVESSSWADINGGVAIHPYAQTGEAVRQSAQGYRVGVDAYSEGFDLPLWVTEFGWPCNTRADGSGYDPTHTPGSPVDDWNDQAAWFLRDGSNNKIYQDISLTQQRDKIKNGLDELVLYRSSLKLACALVFAGSDYVQPSPDWDHHAGLRDIVNAKRASYTTLKNYGKVFQR